MLHNMVVATVKLLIDYYFYCCH